MLLIYVIIKHLKEMLVEMALPPSCGQKGDCNADRGVLGFSDSVASGASAPFEPSSRSSWGKQMVCRANLLVRKK